MSTTEKPRRRDGPKSPTLKRVLAPVKPRRILYTRLRTDTSRTNDLLQGRDPGTTERFARVIGQVVIPNEGRGRAGETALSMLEELYPGAFTPADPTFNLEPPEQHGSSPEVA